jgi:hypothetical protein
LRILVAFEHAYRIYGDTQAAAIRVLRPDDEVESTSLDALREHIERFDPHLVICSQSNTVDAGGRPAWVELSVDPLHPSNICIGGRYSERTNPTFEMVLEVIDEVEELLQTNNDLRGC